MSFESEVDGEDKAVSCRIEGLVSIWTLSVSCKLVLIGMDLKEERERLKLMQWVEEEKVTISF